jgi:hypothetical protein
MVILVAVVNFMAVIGYILDRADDQDRPIQGQDRNSDAGNAAA